MPAATLTPAAALGIAAVLAVLTGCAGAAPRANPPPQRPSVSTSPSQSEAAAPTPTSLPVAEPTAEATTGPVASDGRPQRARLTIPAIGLRGLVVAPYQGWTDDAPGTELQNGGLAASPHGPLGGTGPGGIGNYQVTAHRNSSTAAFAELPALRAGDRVHVEAGGVRYTYEVRKTKQTSFRSPASLADQRAAVPGRPGVRPTRAMITLSTCATQEDHAQGNYWADEFDNPEHRIDKIGVLVGVGESR